MKCVICKREIKFPYYVFSVQKFYCDRNEAIKQVREIHGKLDEDLVQAAMQSTYESLYVCSENEACKVHFNILIKLLEKLGE